jgi:hypothetical protein
VVVRSGRDDGDADDGMFKRENYPASSVDAPEQQQVDIVLDRGQRDQLH